nr:glycoside hydrolase family 95 protein [Pseudoduganella rivuli]
MTDTVPRTASTPKLARRRLLVSAGLAAAFPGLARATVIAETRGDRESLALWYDQPAGQWLEALPVGNGRVGAMVFGRVAQERVQLNEDTLYAGGPYNPNNPQFHDALPKVRALIDQGKYKEASDLAAVAMIGKPGTQMPFGAAGDLLLDFIGLTGAAGYRRRLDLDTAIAVTRFSNGKAQYVREVFASVPGQALVMRLTATGGGLLNFDLGYRHPADAKYGDTRYEGANQAARAVGAAWDVSEPLAAGSRPASVAIRPDGDGALLVEGRNIAAAGIPSALRYAVRIRAVGDGRITAVNDQIQVRDATAVTLLVACATSHVNYADTSADPVAKVRAHSDAAARIPYRRLREEHVQAHQGLFGRMSIRLGAASAQADPRPTHQRIAAMETRPDPALAALYVQ